MNDGMEAWRIWSAVIGEGNGLRDVFESGRDYARFHGKDELCWPAPLQDVGCMLASRGETIAGVYYAQAITRDADRFMFIQSTLRIAWAHEPLWYYPHEQVKYFDEVIASNEWIHYPRAR